MNENENENVSIVAQNFAFSVPCKLRKLGELAVIWTHDRDVRGMGLFLILRHKLLCICDVKS